MPVPARSGRVRPEPALAAGVHVLDLLYVALTVALFAIVGLLAKGVERL
ncbi:MAG: hypothetical protein ABW091_11400 [Microbacterium sp.]